MKNTITYAELMKELDKHRTMYKSKLTKEQENFILKCRDNESPVTYPVMVKLWERTGWGKIGTTTLRNHYKKLKEE